MSEKMSAKEFSEKTGTPCHYLHEEAQDPDYMGVTALCDYVAGLDEHPRQTTLASSVKSEVNCPDCIALMNDGKA